MPNLFIPFAPEYSLQIPAQVSVWMGWGAWLIFLIFSAVRMQQKPIKLDRKLLAWFAGLSVSIVNYSHLSWEQLSTLICLLSRTVGYSSI